MKRCLAVTFAAALLVTSAGPAEAGDEPPAPAAAPQDRGQPLSDVLRDVQRASHLAAWKRAVAIATAESALAASGRIDADRDGRGEHGGLRELTEFPVSEREGGATHPALDPAFAKVGDDGEVVVAGYVYRIFLPGADGRGVHETPGARAAGVEADTAESRWCLYAWPRTYGRTGRFTFFVQEDGVVFAADAPEYSGAGRGPAADAAMAPDADAPGLLGKARLDAVARDGRMWRDPKSIRPDEIATEQIPPHAGPWRSAARLTELGAAACDDVEKALGGAIPGGRPTVRIGTFGDVEAALRADLIPLLARIGMPEKDQAATLSFAAASLVAKYDHRKHEILIVPSTAEITAELFRAPWLLDEDTLRVLLVHTAAQAHDFRSHPLAAAIESIKAREAFTAWSAVVEGHAQFVAERVAKERGLSAAFDRLASALAWSPKTDDPAMDAVFRTFAATIGVPYTAGLRFFQEVDRQGGAAEVARALDAPPRTTREIENPAAWLAGTAASPSVATDAILDRFAKLVGEGWKSNRSAVLANTIRAQVEALGVTDVEHALGGVIEIRGLVAQRQPAGGTLAVLAMRTADDAGTAALERFERRISEAKDRAASVGNVRIASAEYAAGAGAEGALPGFVATKRLQSGNRSQAVVLHVVRLPRCLLEITLAGADEIGRSAVDAAIAEVAKLLADAAAAQGGK